jgi:hypothetical protein
MLTRHTILIDHPGMFDPMDIRYMERAGEREKIHRQAIHTPPIDEIRLEF